MFLPSQVLPDDLDLSFALRSTNPVQCCLTHPLQHCGHPKSGLLYLGTLRQRHNRIKVFGWMLLVWTLETSSFVPFWTLDTSHTSRKGFNSMINMSTYSLSIGAVRDPPSPHSNLILVVSSKLSHHLTSSLREFHLRSWWNQRILRNLGTPHYSIWQQNFQDHDGKELALWSQAAEKNGNIVSFIFQRQGGWFNMINCFLYIL